MTDTAPAAAAPAPAVPEKPAKPGFAFTDDGCRSEIRLGALLMAAGMFLWLFAGANLSNGIAMFGIALQLVGVPIQAWQGRTQGRPGYPWKLAIAFTVLGILLWKDLLFRERYDGALKVQVMAPVFLGMGLWMLAWWPVARSRKKADA